MHQCLALYWLNASAAVLESHYSANTVYQKPQTPLHRENLEAMTQGDLRRFLGSMGETHDFLEFFKTELEAKGVDDVLNEYLFCGSELADNMLVRLYMGMCA